MQIDAEKVEELLQQSGTSLAEHPELAAEMESLNQRLAAAPDFDLDVLLKLAMALLDLKGK